MSAFHGLKCEDEQRLPNFFDIEPFDINIFSSLGGGKSKEWL